jgi:branched-chain amino acid aminotransferase
MAKFCFINGEILPSKKAVIGIDDLGLTRSYAVFDYMRTYNGKPFSIKDHLTRLRSSADSLHLTLQYSDKQIEDFVEQLLSKNKVKEVGIRFLLTGGNSIVNMSFDNPNFIIVLEELPAYPAAFYSEGVKLITYEYQREVAASKTTDYLNALRLSPIIKKAEAFDMLYYFGDEVLELTRNNIFIVKGEKIITPKQNVLLGITRKHIIELAKLQFSIDERKITLKELWNADEVFITGTTKKIIPVNRIDNESYSKSPGEVTKKMMQLFNDFVND